MTDRDFSLYKGVIVDLGSPVRVLPSGAHGFITIGLVLPLYWQ